MFDNYRIESPNGNEIPFQTSIANFQRALRSAEQAYSIVMKLTKKMGRAYLTLQVYQVCPIKSLRDFFSFS